MTRPETVPGVAGVALTANLVAGYDKSTGKVVLATDPKSPNIIGIIPQDYALDTACEVYVRGGAVDARAGEAIPPYSPVTVGADGKVYQARPGDVVLGVYWPDTVATGTDVPPLTVPADELVPLRLMGDKAIMGTGKQTVVGVYDFATDGDASADTIMRDSQGAPLRIPVQAVVTFARYWVDVALAPVDATTVGMHRTSSAAGDPTILSAVAINDAGTPFALGAHDTDLDGAAANVAQAAARVALADDNVIIRASGPLTAGRLTVEIDYFMPLT